MFVVRRRADGQFWRNTTGRGRWGDLREEWVDDLQDVKPYRTVGAAKNSFGVGRIYWPTWRNKHETPHPGECCYKVKWSQKKGYHNTCEHFDAALVEAITRFNATFEILPVHLRLDETVP